MTEVGTFYDCINFIAHRTPLPLFKGFPIIPILFCNHDAIVLPRAKWLFISINQAISEYRIGTVLYGFAFIHAGKYEHARRKVIESKQVLALYGFYYRRGKVGPSIS
jgi:hypothetical protein